MESALYDDHADESYAILLTNCNIWKDRSGGKQRNIDQFRLFEGRPLGGRHEWQGNPKASSLKGREGPIDMLGSYICSWQPFGQPFDSTNGEFKFLIIRADDGRAFPHICKKRELEEYTWRPEDVQLISKEEVDAAVERSRNFRSTDT